MVALVAFWFALADLCGFVHQATERHAVCGEHGELVHVEAGSARALPSDGAAALVAPDPGAQPTHDGDAHCRGCASTADPLQSTVAHPFYADSDPLPADVTALDASQSDVGQLVYRVAPKTSPPLA